MSTDSQPIRVLIVDDHAVVRQGLRTFLELQDTPGTRPIEVVGEAADGMQAVDLARRLQPDIVLLDLVMPVLGGVEATPRIIESSPRSRVVILTSFGEEDRLLPAIRAGAQGYLLKDIPPADLVQAVRTVYAGKVQLHPDVARTLMAAVAGTEEKIIGTGRLGGQVDKETGAEELTARELEVLRLIAAGLNNHEIAAKLVISEKTVKTHVGAILSKLHVADRTQAAIYALRRGLASDPPRT